MRTHNGRSRFGAGWGERATRASGALVVAILCGTADGVEAAEKGEGDLDMAQRAPLVDSDHDGIGDRDEVTLYGLDPFDIDTDGDGLGDGDERSARFGASDPTLFDSDADGLSDLEEVACIFGPCTSAIAADSDGDGFSDRDELLFRRDPLDPVA